ncbi:hypothetical protein [Aquibacillus rhizosphaerae]|uniref:Uncharacterized protein n=1 Tax=Aquibacillus rhizosphaerae TaxID=3051431 RepID=A0ABT7L909_9BACI|nr:hypothetical protein [Aquibacillus sp. LR5S19]MDL4842352.1 hypothetical protein [Aquibacillus sp. LR5S19]
MRIIFEVLRFMVILSLLATFVGFTTQLIFIFIGVENESYIWITAIGVFILMIVLYRNRWKSHIKKRLLWNSIIFIVLLAVLIPDLSPTHFHSTIYVYSYGFPFEFITLRSENGAKFLIPNLFSRNHSWSIDNTIYVNFLLLYFALDFTLKIFNKISKNPVDEVNNEVL